MPKANQGQIKIDFNAQKAWGELMGEIPIGNAPVVQFDFNQARGVGYNAAADDAFIKLHHPIGNPANIPHPFPIPQPPALIKPDFVYHFQGMDLVVPGWATYITQEIDGRIVAHESKPFKFNGAFAVQGGRWSIVVKPEPYDLILEEIQQW